MNVFAGCDPFDPLSFLYQPPHYFQRYFPKKTVTLQMPIFALDLEIHWLSEIV